MELSIEIAGYIQNKNQQRLEQAINNHPELAEVRTSQGITLLTLAAYCRNQQAVNLILARKTRLDLYEAAAVGDIDIVRRHLSGDPMLINSSSVDGFSPLSLACYFGHEELAKFLIQNGADINLSSRNIFGSSPLHSACAIGHLNIAQLLLRRGADVNLCQRSGATALHIAARNGYLGLIKTLVEAGANVKARTEHNQTPAQIAEEKGFSEIISYFRMLKNGRKLSA